MKVAIISDMHANRPALEAVLDDLNNEAPDHIVVAGDLVNRGPHNADVVDIIRAHPEWDVIQGNHDELVADWWAGRAEELYDDPAYAPLHWVTEQLGGERITYLDTLPTMLTLRIPGTDPVLVVHGSPRHNREGLHPFLSDEQIATILADVPERIVVGAHTHIPLQRRVDGRLVLNAGAIGVPFNGDPRAQYLILEWRDGAWHPRFRQVEYDRRPVIEDFERLGYLDMGLIAHIFLQEFITARSHLYTFDRWRAEQNAPLSLDVWQQYLDRLAEEEQASRRVS